MASEEKPPRKLVSVEDTEEDIAHPSLELYRHTMLRGANAGSFLAMVFAPPVLYARGVRDPREILYRTARVSVYGVGIGAGLMALATFLRTYGKEETFVYDRAYRLRYNKGQVHMDKVTYGVVGSGALAGALTAPTMRGMGALLGGSLGFGFSFIVHYFTKGKDD